MSDEAKRLLDALESARWGHGDVDVGEINEARAALDAHLAKMQAALKAALSFHRPCSNIGGGMNLSCIAWKKTNPSHSLCRGCELEVTLKDALNGAS